MNWIVEMMRIYKINPLVPKMVTGMNDVDVHDDHHLHDDYYVVVGEQWETTGDDDEDGEVSEYFRPEQTTRMDDDIHQDPGT